MALCVDQSRSHEWHRRVNEVLEARGCAYRFIGNELGPFTNPIELAEVEASLESAIPAVAEHIRQAISFMPPHPLLSGGAVGTSWA